LKNKNIFNIFKLINKYANIYQIFKLINNKLLIIL